MYIITKKEQLAIVKELDRCLKGTKKEIIYCIGIQNWSIQSKYLGTRLSISLQGYKHDPIISLYSMNTVTKNAIKNIIEDLKSCNNPRDFIAIFCSVDEFRKYAICYDL